MLTSIVVQNSSSRIQRTLQHSAVGIMVSCFRSSHHNPCFDSGFILYCLLQGATVSCAMSGRLIKPWRCSENSAVWCKTQSVFSYVGWLVFHSCFSAVSCLGGKHVEVASQTKYISCLKFAYTADCCCISQNLLGIKIPISHTCGKDCTGS